MLQWNESLVDKMKQGEQGAFEQCYRILSPVIFTVILKICKNRHNANDLLQDTFVDAFENLHTFHQQVPFIAWLKRIAFNNTFNFLQKDKRLVSNIDHLPEQVSSLNIVENELEDNNLLIHLFSQLSKTECLIMWLYIVEQYKHIEIAQLVDKTPSYSKTVVARCLKKLRAKQKVRNYAY